MEEGTRVSKKYTFPFFKQMVWYVLCGCLERLSGTIGNRVIEVRIEDTLGLYVRSFIELYVDYSQGNALPFAWTKVLWQWPYLVRKCMDWIRLCDLSPSDMVRI